MAKSLVNHGSMVIQLRIRAIDDGGLSSESDAIVTISVLDGNDSSVDGPVFDESLYEFTVKENVDQERVIGTVAATSNRKSSSLHQLLFVQLHGTTGV